MAWAPTAMRWPAMSAADPPGTDAVRAQCEAALRRNWREGLPLTDGAPFAYTRPSPSHYPWQWYWDSCFAAIVWRRFDRRALARGSSSRCSPPSAPTGSSATRSSGTARCTRAGASSTTSPRATTLDDLEHPAAGCSPGRGGSPSATRARCRASSPTTTGSRRNRDLDGDGLIWIVQPDESGLDASPQFDPIWGRRAHGPAGLRAARRGATAGSATTSRADRATPAARSCCEVMTNVLHGALAAGARPPVDHPGDRRPDVRRARRAVPRRSRAARARPEPVTWTALAPLALPDLPDEIGRRLVEEHLLDPERFWLPVPPPSVAADDPRSRAATARSGLQALLARADWINSAWLVWLGLMRLGYDAEAADAGERAGRHDPREGLREYYDPLHGRGMGATDFGWSTLALEVIDPHADAESSYVSPRAVPGR